MTPGKIGWDHPDTALYYERFQLRHARYRLANRALVRHAALEHGLHILDVAAGDGATAAAALRHIGERGAVLCFEPAAAMRALGERTLSDPRVAWVATWPVEPLRFDRILCGAAIWQLSPLTTTFRRCHTLLRPGGCLCFDIPSLYLGEPDPPGGGSDPLLLQLPAALAAASTVVTDAAGTTASDDALSDGSMPGAAAVDSLLAETGFRPQRWRFSVRLHQRAYRDWLKIPPITDGILAGYDARERARRIDIAFQSVDGASWRLEPWTGWTAWKIRT